MNHSVFSHDRQKVFFHKYRNVISFRLFYNMKYPFRIGIYFLFPFACFRPYNNPFVTLQIYLTHILKERFKSGMIMFRANVTF